MSTATLRTLAALLQTASTLLDDIGALSEPLLERLVRVFARMPSEDRATVLDVLEREVAMRLLCRSGDPTVTGYALSRPNPAARLYIRAFGSEQNSLEPNFLVRATLRIARMVRLAPVGEHPAWQAATLEAFRALETPERAALAEHFRRMIALLEGEEPALTARAS